MQVQYLHFDHVAFIIKCLFLFNVVVNYKIHVYAVLFIVTKTSVHFLYHDEF